MDISINVLCCPREFNDLCTDEEYSGESLQNIIGDTFCAVVGWYIAAILHGPALMDFAYYGSSLPSWTPFLVIAWYLVTEVTNTIGIEKKINHDIYYIATN